jgi:ABC-type lipoprotein export system ATPase subunit
MFAPAVKTESKLRMAIAGPSGSGKTPLVTVDATQPGSEYQD